MHIPTTITIGVEPAIPEDVELCFSCASRRSTARQPIPPSIFTSFSSVSIVKCCKLIDDLEVQADLQGGGRCDIFRGVRMLASLEMYEEWEVREIFPRGWFGRWRLY